jgi:glucose-6-phosphate isomerase
VTITPSYPPADRLADQLLAEHVVTRIWARDPSAWQAAPDSGAARSIGTRLGWLDVGTTMPPSLGAVTRLAEEARREGVRAVYLLGMGGSSLCAEVLKAVCGVADGHPDLHVLDTTDERTLTRTAASLTPDHTWFIVASKSGGTVEVASMERFFWHHMREALGRHAGRHFVAITDPDTPLAALAVSRGYRETFVNPADIGGRFSALSLFGLVPAALIGAPVADILAAGTAMAEGCQQENHANAGLALGAFIGATVLEGRDKLTVVLPPSLAALGLWIEQLVAESTGKHGKGALPVVDEPLGGPERYGQDRAFVVLSTERDAPDADAGLADLATAGHPILRLSTRTDGLGAEFFRWEFATAVAGAALGINPFDEPNVSEAKEKTRSLLTAFEREGRLPETDPVAVTAPVAVHSRAFAGSSPADVVRTAVESLQPGDYVAFLSYLPADFDVERELAGVRLALGQRARVASTFGLGPRYLHSTGQYHKGGPGTILAFVLTADDDTDTAIPESGHSFSVLKRAQALGDVQALEAHGRRVVRIHASGAGPAAAIGRLFREALR